jgi:hypothetical protein
MAEPIPFDEAEFLRRTFDRSLDEMKRTREYFETLFLSDHPKPANEGHLKTGQR